MLNINSVIEEISTKRKKTISFLREWIVDSLGQNVKMYSNPLSIYDFDGLLESKLLAINLLKEIKTNNINSSRIINILTYLDEYLEKNRSFDPLNRINGFSNYIKECLCKGPNIDSIYKLSFSRFMTAQDIITFNLQENFPIEFDESFYDIDDDIVDEVIDCYEDCVKNNCSLGYFETSLPLFWFTIAEDINQYINDIEKQKKADVVREVLGLQHMKKGYLMEVKFQNDVLPDCRKPLVFDSGPNVYFCVTDNDKIFGRTRRLSNLLSSEFKEAINQKILWPLSAKLKRIGKLNYLNEIPEEVWLDAINFEWQQLKLVDENIYNEIRNLYAQK